MTLETLALKKTTIHWRLLCFALKESLYTSVSPRFHNSVSRMVLHKSFRQKCLKIVLTRMPNNHVLHMFPSKVCQTSVQEECLAERPTKAFSMFQCFNVSQRFLTASSCNRVSEAPKECKCKCVLCECLPRMPHHCRMTNMTLFQSPVSSFQTFTPSSWCAFGFVGSICFYHVSVSPCFTQ